MLVEFKRVKQTDAPRDFLVVHVRFQYKNKNVGIYNGHCGGFVKHNCDLVTGIFEEQKFQTRKTPHPKRELLLKVTMICEAENHHTCKKAVKRKAVFTELVNKFVASMEGKDIIVNANGGMKAMRTKFWDKYKECMRLQ